MNIGDRVKIVSSEYEGDDLKTGRTGVITSVSYDEVDNEYEYKVHLDEAINPVYGKFDWEFSLDQLEVIA